MGYDDTPFPLLFAEQRPVYAGNPTQFDAVGSLAQLLGGFRPNGRNDKVLIISMERDPAADRVAVEMIARGIPLRRFNVETFNHSTSISFHCDERGKHTGILTLPNGVVALEEVKTVWFRRRLFQFLAPGIPTNEVELFIRQESEASLLGLAALLDHAFWVNSPNSLYAAASKLSQLHVASSLGLRVPRTLITNEVERAREFIESCRDGAIVKAFSWLFGYNAETAGVIFTNRVLPDHIAKLYLVRHAPCFFQEEISKEAELRITIIGRRVFPVEITSSVPNSAPADWRDSRAQVTFHPCTLPSSIETACLKLLDHWGLAYAAIDLIRCPSGEYVFLELNPHGNWLHVEDATGLPMTATMADLLERAEIIY